MNPNRDSGQLHLAGAAANDCPCLSLKTKVHTPVPGTLTPLEAASTSPNPDLTKPADPASGEIVTDGHNGLAQHVLGTGLLIRRIKCNQSSIEDAQTKSNAL